MRPPEEISKQITRYQIKTWGPGGGRPCEMTPGEACSGGLSPQCIVVFLFNFPSLSGLLWCCWVWSRTHMRTYTLFSRTSPFSFAYRVKSTPCHDPCTNNNVEQLRQRASPVKTLHGLHPHLAYLAHVIHPKRDNFTQRKCCAIVVFFLSDAFCFPNRKCPGGHTGQS